ncbi:MAG: hypothetical protein AAGJ50_09255, partial [Pseudomonadota bacterium]
YTLSALDQRHIDRFRSMLEQHLERTGSSRAADLLDDFEQTIDTTLMVVPDEVAETVLGNDTPSIAAE